MGDSNASATSRSAAGWVLELDPRRTRYVQWVIGATVLATGVSGLFGLGAYGLDDGLATAQLLVLIASTLVLAVWWCVGPWPSPPALIAFLVYTDLSLAVGVSLMPAQLSSVAGVSLFVVPALITVIATPVAVTVIHLFWSVVTLLVTTYRAIGVIDADMYLVFAVALVTAIVFCSPTVLLIVVAELRSRARSALIDPLTGLANRRGLHAAFESIVRDSAAAGERWTVALVTVDIDGFKMINDQRGHHAGDAALVAFATRLTMIGPECRTIARLGGDEFTCVLAGPSISVDESVAALVAQLRDLQASTGMSVSVGVGATGLTGTDVDNGVFEQALRRADREMYRAKRLRPDNASE